jgi:hypothetical protein
MTLAQLLGQARLALNDLGIKRISEPSLVNSANEGCRELARVLRKSRADYFTTSFTATIPIASPPNASQVSLPSTFAELKDIQITDANYRNIEFLPLDRSNYRYRELLRDGGLVSDTAEYYYDVIGNSTLEIAPGFDIALPVEVTYIRRVPDLQLPSDSPSLIPAEYHDFILAWMTCEGLRQSADPRLSSYESKLQYLSASITESATPRQIRDAVYVEGFMEGLW